MSAIREEFGDRFEQARDEGANSRFYSDRIGDYDRDELLALISWMGNDHKATIERYSADLQFLADLRRSSNG